jgi:hypothetical protein
VLIHRPYIQLQSLFDSGNPKGRRYYQKSEYLPGIEPALCEKVIAHAAKIPSPFSVIMLFQIEGALNRFAEDHSPVGNRNAHFVSHSRFMRKLMTTGEISIVQMRGTT